MSVTDPHTDPRSQTLALLADPAVVTQLIAAWRVPSGEVPEPATWTRHYARVRETDDGWATLVYELTGPPQRLVAIQVADRSAPGAVHHPQIGWLRLTAFPEDPGLPGLQDVLARLDGARVIRYRYGRRCTLAGQEGNEPRFVKVAATAERLFTDATEIWRGVAAHGLALNVAQPLEWDPATSSFWQARVPGEPVATAVLGDTGDEWSFRLGRALGELARVPFKPSRTITADDQLARTWRAARHAAALFPWLAPRIDAVMAGLEARHRALAPRALVPVHGAPHMHQWLADGDTLGLVDFDRFAMGEPELDVATFVAELETEGARRLPVESLRQAMEEGFRAAGGLLDDARTDLYLLHKRMSKVTRTAWAVRPDRARRTESHVGRIEAVLESPAPT